ncbi:PP2C family protein-serine/threonine phosphatase [Mesobaculum littorinae]|uniref:PP2C family protein-serine/threonine phosphatase n=1 Tax=Mesobaculum littorinae TaxID=2486419 RepID=UPI001F370049|nr:fused response regulator/phosphatase [Mesobaculum littorinae]
MQGDLIFKHGRIAPEDAVQRVLVVDDSASQRKLLCSYLRRWGFQVGEAATGQAALDLCAAEGFDLVLSDWTMPGMTGPEFCAELRRRGGERYVYFVLLTLKASKDDIAQGLEGGADDFIVKPVNPHELRARITAANRILGVERELIEKNRLVTRTLTRLRGVYEGLNRDLIEARKLQNSLVPTNSVSLPGGTLSFLFQPSGHVGGDLVGYFPVAPDRIGLYSLDVSGHGVASALITARLAARLSGATPDRNDALCRTASGAIAMLQPEEICAKLNSDFLREVETEHYFTLAIAEIDLTARRAWLAQAGHPNPLVQRAAGGVEFPGTGGLPLGLIEGAEFERIELEFEPGDRLFLYSDGVTECPTPDGGMLDEDGLADIFVRNAGLRGQQALNALSWDLSALIDGQDFPDDLSGALLEFR